MIRDLTSESCIELLRNTCIGRLAYIAHDVPYVIPVTFYYYQPNNSIISYSLEGHKINSMRKKNTVSLQVDEIEMINQWKSVLVHGEFEEITGINAKKLLNEFSKGVKEIINSKEEKKVQFIHEFSRKIGVKDTSPIVYQIKILEITGKERVG
jgi:nitroimidazol reductase NimA-like FMN-containing flavoprotein (pyridoxamine 5'-phosphate oxidase superfamily)